MCEVKPSTKDGPASIVPLRQKESCWCCGSWRRKEDWWDLSVVPVTDGNLALINQWMGGNGVDVAGAWMGWGAVDAAVPPGVRKRGHDGYSWAPGKEVSRERGGGSLVGTLRILFVAVSLKWIQGGWDFFREEKKGEVLLWKVGLTLDAWKTQQNSFLWPLHECSCVAKLS